jgi:hypothetical protein
MESKTTDLKDLLSSNNDDDEEGRNGENDGKDEIETIDSTYLSGELTTEEEISLDDEIKEEKVEEELKKEPSLFDKEWTKLEKGMKLNRVSLFIQREKEENKLSDAQTKSLKDILFKACNDGMLNKASDVTYKDEQIISIRNLEFNEQTKKYKLKTSSSKHRVNVKSRSNIDRFMKKS